MFKVSVNSLAEYFTADPIRRPELEAIDTAIRSCAPSLTRWFYDGIHNKTDGMKMQLIGYGSFQYMSPDGRPVTWPVIGIALQKNYISVYMSATKHGKPIFDEYRGKLNELRSGRNNFSYISFEALERHNVQSLFREIASLVDQSKEDNTHYR